MAERIFIGAAWPYANGPLHLGHIAGAYLPADIFARYHRIKGNEVLFVSGSDQHGTPITIRAEQEGTTPEEIANKYHKEFLNSWDRLGIGFDLFTNTEAKNHAEVVQDVFLKLLDKGYIYKDSMPLPYCSSCQRYLPDRYVEGTCPHCGYADARGDSCEKCGRPIGFAELINSHCKKCGNSPQVRESEHFFLKLSAFRDKLHSWVRQQTHWRPNVHRFTLRLLEEGLKDRAITRDITWGIEIPQPGFEDKRIYVWFDAVIGYLSASMEWAKLQGKEENWKPFWQEGVKSYYFIGKDNIPFHTIIWPSMLMGYGGLSLPYDVPSNEFLTLEGRQLSTSRNWAVWVPDYLERYAPDHLRFFLSVSMPENGDTDFSWREFVRRNNDELVATFGNLVHRVLSFTYRNFDGCVPAPGEMDMAGKTLLDKAKDTINSVDESIRNCHFRDGIKAAMSLSQDTNRYLEEKSPWKVIKTDREACATTLYVALSVISCLKTVLYPYLPFSSQKLHKLLGFEGAIEKEKWGFHSVPAGQKLAVPEPLFVKLDDSVVSEETNRLSSAPC